MASVPVDKAQTAWQFLSRQASVIMLELTAEGIIREANTFAETFTGMDLRGRPLLDMVVNFDPEITAEYWWQPTDQPRRINVHTASGSPQSLYATVYTLADGFLWFAQVDGVEQERLQQQLLRLNQELSQVSRELQVKNAELKRLDALKNQFLGMAAHDLRGPVGLVLFQVDDLMDSAKDRLTAEDFEELAALQGAALRMRGMIDDFLDVALIEAGKFPLKRAWVNLPSLLKEVGELSSVPGKLRQVKLILEPAAGLPPWNLDGPKLAQALVNLVRNAIDHSPRGSLVRLGCRFQEGLLFWVTDQGPGFSDEQKRTLFQAFSGAGRKKSDGERSAGLGLTIASKIVEAHGGSIRVESAANLGTTVWIALPEFAPERSAGPACQASG